MGMGYVNMQKNKLVAKQFHKSVHFLALTEPWALSLARGARLGSPLWRSVPRWLLRHSFYKYDSNVQKYFNNSACEDNYCSATKSNVSNCWLFEDKVHLPCVQTLQLITSLKENTNIFHMLLKPSWFIYMCRNTFGLQLCVMSSNQSKVIHTPGKINYCVCVLRIGSFSKDMKALCSEYESRSW